MPDLKQGAFQGRLSHKGNLLFSRIVVTILANEKPTHRWEKAGSKRLPSPAPVPEPDLEKVGDYSSILFAIEQPIYCRTGEDRIFVE
jgi:hypothetical protein